MDDLVRRQTLAHFLQTRRARLTPESQGLAAGPRRRTPGLRREEVAILAGVGLTWYTWLEQGRAISVSDQVLESIACALQLAPDETRYLFTLAKRPPAEPSDGAAEQVSQALHHLLSHYREAPAFILGKWWDILAWNEATSCLLGNLGRLPPEERNHVWLMFTNPDMRKLLCDWEMHAQRMVAEFRVCASRYLEEERSTALVERLLNASQEFRAWWPRHDILTRRCVYKDFEHPVVGKLSFEQTTLIASDAPDFKVVVKMPLPGTATAERMCHLLSLSDTAASGA
jgi:transcriptional regulator with XRE-family HTH domain